MNSFVFSSDGIHVASGSKDSTVCIWNVVTGESEAELRAASSPGSVEWLSQVVPKIRRFG